MESNYDDNEYFPLYYARTRTVNYVIASIHEPTTIKPNNTIYFDDIEGARSLKGSVSNNIFNIREKSLVAVRYNFTGNVDNGGYVGILPRLNGNILKNYISQVYSKEGIYSMSASFLLDPTKSETNYLDFVYLGSNSIKNFNGHVSIIKYNG